MDRGELLMAEILAMGGSKQDLELLDGIDSGSEIEDLDEDEEDEEPEAKKAAPAAKKTDKKKKASEEIVEVKYRQHHSLNLESGRRS